ncbi:hypothetical protein [Pseudonocardia sp. TRM90224]|uniref:hypothetical protein n=1 Tax=Pseudonocardia sp. TRM90224 TaxID=2812678 RepID=UPI001E33A673|nr:hypothetical protein [Pseudonocardia sp. TRM90224]
MQKWSPTRAAARTAVAAAFGVLLLGATAAPALAGEAGVITKPFGKGFPTYADCSDFGQRAMAREHADDWECYRQSNGRYDGYLFWYTA